MRTDHGFVHYSVAKPHLDSHDSSAKKAMSALRAELLAYRHNKTRQYPGFEMLTRTRNGNIIREDFFNMRMTVVLPSWPARFQEPEFRAYVEDLFRNSAPAYIQMQFIWMSAPKLKEFEHVYFEWLEALKVNSDENPWADRLAMLIGASEFVVKPE